VSRLVRVLSWMVARLLVGDLVDACDRQKVTADLRGIFDELERRAA
jgi:hypothetical protein